VVTGQRWLAGAVLGFCRARGSLEISADLQLTDPLSVSPSVSFLVFPLILGQLVLLLHACRSKVWQESYLKIRIPLGILVRFLSFCLLSLSGNMPSKFIWIQTSLCCFFFR
jgi:hypothetical protein